MAAVRVIPCLDVWDGRVVKGVRFQGLRDVGDPRALAARYEAEGADELVFLDVGATPVSRIAACHVIEDVRQELRIPLTAGGGVSSVDDARRLLDAGADKVAVNTAAVRRPELITELADRYGRQCIVVAIDAARAEPHGWTLRVVSGVEQIQRDVCNWAVQAHELGAGELLLTSWDRDGTGAGYDTDLIEAVCRAVPLPVIASGGVSRPEHCVSAVRAGATGVLAASVFHDRVWTIEHCKRVLSEAGIPVRPPRQALMETQK